MNKINGKFYIGVTGRPFHVRRHEHVRDALRGVGKGAFAHAIRKHGGSAFVWKVLGRYRTLRQAVDLEKSLIRGLRPPYNSTYGGEGYAPRVWTEDARRRISEANKGKARRLGATHSQRTKNLLRKLGLRDKDKWLRRSHLGPEAQARPVVCLNDETQHASASAAARAYGLNKSAVIEVCGRAEWRHHTGGYVFRYIGDHTGGIEEAHRMLRMPKANNKVGLKGVYKYVCDGRETGRFRAERRVNGKKIKLGVFNTAEAAHAAYIMACGESF